MSHVDANLYIFGGSQNQEYIKGLFPPSEHQYHLFDLGMSNLTQESYSMLLQTTHFWRQIKEENILIFQTDSFIVQPRPIEQFLEWVQLYGYLGGRYQFGIQLDSEYHHLVKPLKYPCNRNGGFSLRTKSAMLACLANVSRQDVLDYRSSHGLDMRMFQKFVLPEDVYFDHALAILNYPFPSQEELDQFATQHVIHQDMWAIHGFDKPYLTELQIEELLLLTEQQNEILYVTSNR